MSNYCKGLESEELNMDEGAVYICKRLLYELPQNDLETKLYENWVLLANNDLNDGIKVWLEKLK